MQIRKKNYGCIIKILFEFYLKIIKLSDSSMCSEKMLSLCKTRCDTFLSEGVSH